MTVSRKIRFEVFKRDGFQCIYCGKAPPEVMLECDHINPKSKGGKDDLSNLATACFGCNRGKTNIPIDKIPPKMDENLEVLKARESQLVEYNKFLVKVERRRAVDVKRVAAVYAEQNRGNMLSDEFKQNTVKRFVGLLPVQVVVDAMAQACATMQDRDRSLRYFCGICWNKIKGNRGERGSTP